MPYALVGIQMEDGTVRRDVPAACWDADFWTAQEAADALSGQFFGRFTVQGIIEWRNTCAFPLPDPSRPSPPSWAASPSDPPPWSVAPGISSDPVGYPAPNPPTVHAPFPVEYWPPSGGVQAPPVNPGPIYATPPEPVPSPLPWVQAPPPKVEAPPTSVGDVGGVNPEPVPDPLPWAWSPPIVVEAPPTSPGVILGADPVPIPAPFPVDYWPPVGAPPTSPGIITPPPSGPVLYATCIDPTYGIPVPCPAPATPTGRRLQSAELPWETVLRIQCDAGQLWACRGLSELQPPANPPSIDPQKDTPTDPLAPQPPTKMDDTLKQLQDGLKTATDLLKVIEGNTNATDAPKTVQPNREIGPSPWFAWAQRNWWILAAVAVGGYLVLRRK